MRTSPDRREGVWLNRRPALVAVVVSAACFGTLAVLAPLAYAEGARPLPLLAWRFALVTLLMAGYQMLRDPAKLLAGRSDAPSYVLMSFTGYGAASLCFFFALEHASASVVAVLLYTYPAIVSVLSSVFLKERFTAQRALAIVLTFMGCALVVGLFSEQVSVDLVGLLLGLGAALGYSTFNMLSHRVMARQPRAVVMTYTFGFSAVAMTLASLATGESLMPAEWTAGAWALLIAIVLVPTFAAIVLYLQGIRSLGPSQAAIVSTTEPLFTIVLAAIVLGERLAPVQLLGAALVVGGVLAAEWRRKGLVPDEFAPV